MAPSEPTLGPLQLLVVGFETTEHFDGQIARELRDLRGRGLIRVVDARLLSRSADGDLTDTDLNEIIGEPLGSPWRPAAHLFGLNGAGHAAAAAGTTPETYARTAGFEVDDLRRLTDEIGRGEHAAVVLVEHVWAARLRSLVRDLIADGGTAVYDATIQGFEAVRALRDRERINAVVLLTDGEDTDSAKSVDDVVREAEAQGDSESRVRVFTIAYSPSAQGAEQSLERIATASGGKAYSGDTDDIELVYRSISSFF